MKNAIIFVIALAISNLAVAESPAHIHGKYAAPFGLEWGMSKEELAEMGVKLTPGDSVEDVYTATTLPKNLSDAERYGLFFMQGVGLVKILVFTRKITNDVFGSKGKERYSQLKTAIINKYGKPSREVEETGRTSIHEGSDQFYQCLKHDGCGGWISLWGDGTNGGIALQLLGLGRGIGVVTVYYESAAFHIAQEQEDEEKARSDEDAL